jgi:hypothetical protein
VTAANGAPLSAIISASRLFWHFALQPSALLLFIIIVIIIKIPARAFIAFLPFPSLTSYHPTRTHQPKNPKNQTTPTLPHPTLSQTHPKKIPNNNKFKKIIFLFPKFPK